MIQLFKKIFADSFIKKGLILLTQRGGAMILSFILLYLLTHFFKDELIGQYQYYNSVLIIIGTLCLMGLNTSFIQFSGLFEAEQSFWRVKNLYIRYVFILSVIYILIILLFFLIKTFAPIYLLSEEQLSIIKKVIYTLWFYCLAILNYQVILGLKKLYLSEFLRNLFKTFCFIILVIFLDFLKKEKHLINGFSLTYVFIAVCSIIPIVYLLNKIKTPKEATSNKTSYKKIVQVSLPMTISAMSILLMQNIDLLILKQYSSFKTIAYYGVAIKIASIFIILTGAIGMYIMPQVSTLFYKKNLKMLSIVIQKSINIHFLITFPLLAILIIFPSLILNSFGENYKEAQTALIILLTGQLSNSLVGPVDVFMNMTGQQKTFQRIIFTSLILNVVLNYILIPRFGMNGAAFSTALSTMVWNIAGAIYIKRKNGISLFIKPKFLIGFIISLINSLLLHKIRK